MLGIKVINNEIAGELVNLPNNYETGGEKKYLPVEFSNSYNPLYQDIVSIGYDIQPDRVIASYNTTDKDIEYLKSEKIIEIKIQAGLDLAKTDWKVIRHRDQVEANQSTSLSNEEYQTLLNDRQSVRDKSNDLEEQINQITEVENIDQINW